MSSLFFPLLLLSSFEWTAGQHIPRLTRHHSSAASPHVLSRLLVSPNPKFSLRDNGDGCDNGWHACPNFPNICAPDGSYCCSAIVVCPDGSNCYGFDQCCPQNAQTCGGQNCCLADATCCNDSFGGCCPVGTVCIPGTDNCTVGGSGSTNFDNSGDAGGGNNEEGSGPSSPSAFPSSSVSKFAAPSIITPTITTAGLPTTGGISTSNAFGVATPSGVTVPITAGTSGSPLSISMTSIGGIIALAGAVAMIALGGSVF